MGQKIVRGVALTLWQIRTGVGRHWFHQQPFATGVNFGKRIQQLASLYNGNSMGKWGFSNVMLRSFQGCNILGEIKMIGSGSELLEFDVKAITWFWWKLWTLFWSKTFWHWKYSEQVWQMFTLLRQSVVDIGLMQHWNSRAYKLMPLLHHPQRFKGRIIWRYIKRCHESLRFCSEWRVALVTHQPWTPVQELPNKAYQPWVIAGWDRLADKQHSRAPTVGEDGVQRHGLLAVKSVS